MDAVDYFNSGLRKMRDRDFIGTRNDFTCAINGDKSTAQDDKELEILAYLHRGMAYYNQTMVSDSSTEMIMLSLSARSDCEKVIELDPNSKWRSQAEDVIRSTRRIV